MKWGTAYALYLDLVSQETDDCVLWTGSRIASGYGNVWHQGEMHYTHRLSCTMAHGSPPSGRRYEAAHSCHNRHCLNPRHLRWATVAENQADRLNDGTDQFGEKNPSAKLTEFDVRAIRHYVKCGTKQRVLVDHYKVSPSCISAIVRGAHWGWL